MSMGDTDRLEELRKIVADDSSRIEKLQQIAALIRNGGSYRWVGLYDVDRLAGEVVNLVWDGPGAPEYPTFPIGKGLTGSAIQESKIINVGDVAADPRYLTAFGSTRSEIIVPIFSEQRDQVVGTIDVESERLNAFDEQTKRVLVACADVIAPLWG
jgi:putative methionine-R-sulfoxide reductase with GAF domain